MNPGGEGELKEGKIAGISYLQLRLLRPPTVSSDYSRLQSIAVDCTKPGSLKLLCRTTRRFIAFPNTTNITVNSVHHQSSIQESVAVSVQWGLGSEVLV
ncbi:uncharacterized protein LAJ45_06173 [Morchella importuna]|uniref:uncharacterized protein n=1 Tax=Morchella importuna TaxID=1174673 RepID=UPI001E8CBE0C|nr:uncharacterized protein LAJ45_06173 [Morchella importuna]KAH8149545.1 hypothetical protein LAJ45_06173 [Morchella importuna]